MIDFHYQNGFAELKKPFVDSIKTKVSNIIYGLDPFPKYLGPWIMEIIAATINIESTYIDPKKKKGKFVKENVDISIKNMFLDYFPGLQTLRNDP